MKKKDPRKDSRPRYLVQVFRAWRYGVNTWRSMGAFIFEDEAVSLFAHLQSRKHRDRSRLYPDIRMIRGGTVLRSEREGTPTVVPPSLEERVAALEKARAVGAVDPQDGRTPA